MLNEIKKTLSEGSEFSQRLFDVTAQYIFFLGLYVKDHTFEAASEAMGLDASRYSAFLNSQGVLDQSERLLNRVMRRYLHKKGMDGRIVIIIDSTLWRRKGKKIENRGSYNHGQGHVFGHKFLNIVIARDGKIIPLASIPHLTKDYCRDNGLKYLTEIDMTIAWIKNLPELNLFSAEEMKRILFLMDSGYDCKDLQRVILKMGCHFVMALKTSRSVGDSSVSQYFKSPRHLTGQSIRLTVGSGGKNSRRTYSVRLAKSVQLKGVGPVHVACSKKRDGTKKYLASSDRSMTARDIVFWYSKRWQVETWHREIKQNFGFIDCRASRFSAIHSHVNFVMVSYILHKESGQPRQSVQEYMKSQSLKEVRNELTKFGGAVKARALINAALQDIAA